MSTALILISYLVEGLKAAQYLNLLRLDKLQDTFMPLLMHQRRSDLRQWVCRIWSVDLISGHACSLDVPCLQLFSQGFQSASQYEDEKA